MITRNPSIRSRLQERSHRLREEVDASVRAERQQATRTLLRRPLLFPEGPTASEFARVRRHGSYLAEWFAHHAAWTLSIGPEVIRLRKTPADPEDATRPATDPKSGEPFNRRRYALFCIALGVLERGDRQITLGTLVEQMSALLASEPEFEACGVFLDREKQSSRRDLVLVLRLLVELGALRRVQGDEDSFVRNRESDALYNVERARLAALPAGNRSPSLLSAEETLVHRKLIDAPAPSARDAQNRAFRLGLIRRLLDNPVLYFEDLSDGERAYLESQRTFILRDLEDGTGLVPEVRAEGIALCDLFGDATDIGLPEEGTEGHLTLLLATWMADHLRRGGGTLTLKDTLAETRKLISQHARHWRKDASEEGAEKRLLPDVLERLEGLGLVRLEGDGILPYPAIGRYALAEAPEEGRGSSKTAAENRTFDFS
ncbi:MAG: TIGR02678 family protein [Opitutales bacterium]|nr:TIGR02678 family protein [Opitutales bacterium]MCH8541516.1 TIGR02678 family protein [Opitutales bacterium]